MNNNESPPPSLIFSVLDGNMVLKLYLPPNATEEAAVDLVAVCLLVIGRNGELMDACLNQAKELTQHSNIVLKGLSMHKTKRKPVPAIGPFEVLKF